MIIHEKKAALVKKKASSGLKIGRHLYNMDISQRPKD